MILIHWLSLEKIIQSYMLYISLLLYIFAGLQFFNNVYTNLYSKNFFKKSEKLIQTLHFYVLTFKWLWQLWSFFIRGLLCSMLLEDFMFAILTIDFWMHVKQIIFLQLLFNLQIFHSKISCILMFIVHIIMLIM